MYQKVFHLFVLTLFVALAACSPAAVVEEDAAATPTGEAAAPAGDAATPSPAPENVLISGQILAGDGASARLPAGSQIVVQVQDTGLADAPALVLGEQVLADGALLPAGYAITVDAAALAAAVQVGIAARVEGPGGELLYINDTAHPLPPGETTVDVDVVAVQPAPEALPSAFDGVRWQWLAFEDSASGAESNDVVVEQPARYTLTFLADGSYQLLADCNRGSGQFTVDGSSLALAPGPLTLAACGPDSLAGQFVNLLADVVTFVFDQDGNLVLNLKLDAGNMIFGRAGAAEPPLAGTGWLLQRMVGAAGNSAIPAGAEITAQFEEGRVAGSAGCNNYFADYEAEGTALRLGPIGSTRMACEEALNRLEADFLAAMSETAAYRLTPGSLELLDGEGRVRLVWTAAGAPSAP